MMVIIHIQDDVCHPECQGRPPRKEGTASSVGSSQADKAASHERIVETASRGIRRDGIDKVRVAELMKQAGLTHGGFYRHFESRDDLVAEAIAEALAHGSQRVQASAKHSRPAALAAIVDGYLSRLHCDKPETGCAVAALPTDVARCGPRARAAYSRQVRSYLELLTELTPDRDPDRAHLILAALVGALVLARAIDDRGLSDELLERAARALHRYVDDGQEA
jgi:TetR/AcrR family transcriptional regulator, transcriptional repressor for nem operon